MIACLYLLSDEPSLVEYRKRTPGWHQLNIIMVTAFEPDLALRDKIEYTNVACQYINQATIHAYEGPRE